MPRRGWRCSTSSRSSSSRSSSGCSLIVDLDGQVLEAAHANVWIREGERLITPPLDGRLLPGTARARLLATCAGRAREEPIPLGRLAAADEILLTSAIRGLHPARLRDPLGPPRRPRDRADRGHR